MMRLSTFTIVSLLVLLQSPVFDCYGYIRAISITRFPTSLQLNRIFCDMDELTSSSIGEDSQGLLILTVNESDNRCKHIRNILKLNVGDTLKGGVIDIGTTDDARILDITKDEGIKISLGPRSKLQSNDRPLVDLILAVPRPLRLERILSVISCIGVGSLVLTGASKVQNDYFGSHLFRRPEEMKICLVEGMSQAASDCMIPNVLVRRNFLKFVTDEMDALFPVECYHRLVAHPPSVTLNAQPIRINQLEKDAYTHSSKSDLDDTDDSIDSIENIENLNIENDSKKGNSKKKIVVAVGPEGGWEDEEVLLLLSKGFSLVSLGPRILRTDMAVSVLLGLAHDWTDNAQ